MNLSVLTPRQHKRGCWKESFRLKSRVQAGEVFPQETRLYGDLYLPRFCLGNPAPRASLGNWWCHQCDSDTEPATRYVALHSNLTRDYRPRGELGAAQGRGTKSGQARVYIQTCINFVRRTKKRRLHVWLRLFGADIFRACKPVKEVV